MINHTLFEYLFIRGCISFLHAIGPLSTAYTALSISRAVVASSWPTLSLISLWCGVETAFFLFFLWYRTHLQREALHPPPRSREERRALFDKVKGEIHNPAQFLSGWFRGAKVEEIGKEELKGWLDWAFWDGRLGPDDEEEMEELVKDVEDLVGKRFPDGKGTAKGLRLTLDPIEMEWRSLLWYGCMMIVDTITHVRMLKYGMQYHRSFATTWKVFPPRPLAAVPSTKRSEATSLSYWTRPHTSKTRPPILFIHGIGVGVYPYVEFFHEVDIALNKRSEGANEDDGQVGILVLEILQTSSRLTPAILTSTEFLEQITTILDANSYDRFTLASHSYGSVLSTHMLTSPSLASRIASTLLIDPVTILLHMPDVAYNFTIRKPESANEWQLWYFASKDPGVAHTLGRHFFWSENVLWRDHIMGMVDHGMKITVSLASRDLIVDTKAVGAYLMEHEVPDPVVVEDDVKGEHMELNVKDHGKGGQAWKTRPWRGEGLEVMWWDDLDHAQVFDDKRKRAKLVEVLAVYSKGP
ncbi:hypothetical protein LTR82_007867 [Friedmanniomyces endolithicus]|uniref:AB hydrolase-1 domain-containing protein n=1 Tax=Friedmanniomyces endolithicus TaxID=329885 RepID=A0AAN6J930_9PEZI|nr:hypothetical protein LTR82_007867 [Friedmanniomyces endolithicus]